MRNEQALVVCAFGWGKEFRLYRETLYVANTTYRLIDLTGVRLVRRQALGVPSARLELQFGRRTVVLRGIAAVEEASKAAEYLATWCQERPREEADVPASDSSLSLHLMQPTKQPRQTTQMTPFMLSLPSLPSSPTTTFHERVTHAISAPETPLALAQRKERHTEIQRGWRRERKMGHLAREKTQGAQVTQATKAAPAELPVVTVPVRLAEGEQAHFSAKATHCGERISETLRSTYPAQDHGLLILTNRRMLYIGRKSQIVLEYQHLLHLSRLHGALAFEADHWQKRALFTMTHSEACAACLEAILQKNNAPAQSSISSLSGLPGSSSEPGVPAMSASRRATEVYIQ